MSSEDSRSVDTLSFCVKHCGQSLFAHRFVQYLPFRVMYLSIIFIKIGWENISKSLGYFSLFQIEWAPRFASMCITQLVEYIQYHPVKPVPPEKIHTIGYSVGAHILGLVANHLTEGKLGRITGTFNLFLFH